MQEHFNTASLAKLSRFELLTMLANLQSQFNTASSDAERAPIKAKMTKIAYALTLK